MSVTEPLPFFSFRRTERRNGKTAGGDDDNEGYKHCHPTRFAPAHLTHREDTLHNMWCKRFTTTYFGDLRRVR